MVDELTAAEEATLGEGREAAAMSVRSAAVWSMVGQYLSFAILFATSVIISRFFLDPAEVGLFSIAMAAAMLVAVLQDFGLSKYISGLPRLDRAEVSRCSSVGLVFSLAIAAVIAAAAFPIASLYGQPDLAPILLILALSYLIVPFVIVPMALMGRRMQFRGRCAVDVGGALAQAGAAIALAAMGFSSFSLAWGAVAMMAARAVIAQTLSPAMPFPLRLDGIGAIASFGSRSSILMMSGALGTRTPDLIIGKLLTLAATGLYSRASSLADQLRMLIAGAIGGVFYPAFARIRDKGEPMGPAYLRVCAGYSAVIWPGMAGLALASEPLVRLLYGETWLGVAPLLALVAISEMLIITLPLAVELPILAGKLNRLILLNLLDTTLSIGLLALGCLWGVEGAAASRVVYAALWIGIYAKFMHRVVGFDARALLAIYFRSGLATLAAIAPLALVYSFHVGPADINFTMLMVAVIAGGCTWLAALAALRHPAFGELLGMAAALPLPAPLRAALAR